MINFTFNRCSLIFQILQSLNYEQFFVPELFTEQFLLLFTDFEFVDFVVLLVQQVFFDVEDVEFLFEVLAFEFEQDFVLLLPLVISEFETFEQFFVSFVFVFLPNI